MTSPHSHSCSSATSDKVRDIVPPYHDGMGRELVSGHLSPRSSPLQNSWMLYSAIDHCYRVTGIGPSR